MIFHHSDSFVLTQGVMREIQTRRDSRPRRVQEMTRSRPYIRVMARYGEVSLKSVVLPVTNNARDEYQ